MKIRAKITLWITLLVGILTLISSTSILFAVREYTYSQKTKEAFDKADKVQNLISVFEKDNKYKNIYYLFEDPKLLSKTIQNEGTKIYEGSYLQAVNIRGVIFSRSPNLGDKKLPIMKSGTMGQLTLELPTRNGLQMVNIFYLSQNLRLNNKDVGYLQVGIPLIKVDNLFNQLLLFQVINFFISIFAAAILGRFLSKRSLKPMTDITDEVNNMVGQNLLKNLETSKLSKDEIGMLVITFNQLIDRISSVFTSQQRFISDASHELRSPLTSIKGYAQLLLKRGKENPELTKDGIEIIIKESERLERLVNDMLFLVRSGEKFISNDNIEIVSVIRQLVLDLRPLHSNLSIEDINFKAFINGESDSIKRVFINLINNALRAVQDKGFVNINMEIIDNRINILVKDNGTGIEEEHIEKIFERFYRVDTSRERNKGGSGLGLSIVKEIIESNNGTVSVKSKINKGSLFIVSFPLNYVTYQ